MELMTLDPGTIQVDKLIEGYQSLIWSERFSDPGDFKLVTADVEDTMAKLPLDSMVTLRDSLVVMVVEDHLIEEIDGIDILTVTGRSFDAATMTHRVAANDVTTATPNEWQMTMPYNEWGIHHVIEGIMMLGRLSSYDRYLAQDFEVLVSGTLTPDDQDMSVKVGQLDTVIRGMLKEADSGLIIARNEPPAASGITMYVYTGVDRTADQDDLPPVIFSASAGHFEKCSYLFSTRDKKNIAYVFSPVDSKIVVPKGGSSTVAGMDRKVLYVDANDITKVTAGTTINKMLDKRGRIELSKHNGKGIFQGTLKPSAIPYKYMVDYACGDKVSVQAKYGIEETMRVTEFIRTQTDQGEQSFPTLSKIELD